MKIYIANAKSLNKEELKKNHNSRYEDNTCQQKQNGIGYHNLVYVGFTEDNFAVASENKTKLLNDVYKITGGHFVCPSDITKDELYECCKWFWNKKNIDSLYGLLEKEQIGSRKKNLLCFTYRLKALITAGQDICLAFLSDIDTKACEIVKDYISFLETN